MNEDEKKSNPLFDLINALFTSREYVYNVTEETARQNLFMILRRIAIKYPLEMNVFNDSKVNPLDTIKFLSDYLYCGTVPKWVYTSVKSSKKKSKDDITKDDITLYKSLYDLTDKDISDLLRFHNDEVIQDIKDNRDFYKKLNSNRYETSTDN